jgi:hypothetical protein
MLLVLILFMGVSIDAARVHLAANQLQNAADAAALAGARYVAWDPNSTTKMDARLKALEYANYNYAANTQVNLFLNTDNEPNGDIVIGRFISQLRIFIPTTDTPNAMKVVTRKKDGQANAALPLVFGPIVHVNTADIERFATAMIYNASGAAVIGLNLDNTALYLHGNPEINIDNGGSIYSNTLEVSADFRGNPFTDVSEINLVGDYHISGSNFDPDELTYHGIPSTMNSDLKKTIADPYADRVEPEIAAPSPTAPADGNTLKISVGTYTLQPGYYPGGIEITGGIINLTPGIYQVNGTATHGGLSITGGITTADQVMFHIVGGSVDIRGNTQFTLSPPAPEDYYAGISIFQSRTNYSDAEINGTGGLNLTGALYFPNNHLEVSGTGDTIGTQLVADTIEFGGNGVINIPYIGFAEIANSSFLVE